MLKLLLLSAVGGVAYLLYKSNAADAAKANQTKGTLDPNYNPTASVFAADQPNSGMESPIIPRNTLAHGPRGTALVNGEWVYGPSGATRQTCGPASGVSGGCPTPGPHNEMVRTISPYFWAADKVPTNQALQVPSSSIDANPYLDFNSGRISPVGAQPPTPVNHA